MIAKYIRKIVYNMICVTAVFIQGRNLACFVSQVSGLVKNFTIGIYSDKLCMMVLLIELYLFISLSVTMTIFQGHSSVKQFWTETFVFSSN